MQFRIVKPIKERVVVILEVGKTTLNNLENGLESERTNKRKSTTTFMVLSMLTIKRS